MSTRKKSTREMTANLFDRGIHGVRCLLMNQLHDVVEEEDEHRAGHADHVAAVLFACRKLLVDYAPETARRIWLADCQRVEGMLRDDSTHFKEVRLQRKEFARAAKNAQDQVNKLLETRHGRPAEPAAKPTRKRVKKVDPEKNLEEQLKLANRFVANDKADPEVQHLAELVIALNDWLRKGGFSPKAWDAKNRLSKEEFIRAGGDVLCEECGDEYRHHARDKKRPDYNEDYPLHVLCSGQRVKL